MLADNAPDPGEWAEDWFRTWKSRKDNPNNLLIHEKEDFESVQQDMMSVSKGNGPSFIENDSLDESPQIGTICTMRFQIGERVSRVHHAYTSHLRRSRFRKKYIRHGDFQST